jgi:hypothetical protein
MTWLLEKINLKLDKKWGFLIFLILIVNVKIPVKLLGILFGLIINPNPELKKFHKPIFYLLMPILVIIGYLINLNFDLGTNVIILVNVFIWLFAYLIMCQSKSFISILNLKELNQILVTFFMLNAIVTLIQLLLIMIECQSFNPYLFEGLSLKYHTSTGDYLKGISFDICTTNTIINAFGVFYFLFNKKHVMSLLCFVIMLLTTSNLSNFIFTFFLLCLLFLSFKNIYKNASLFLLALMILFMLKIAFANVDYIKNVFNPIPKNVNVIQIHKNEVAQKWPMNVDSLLRVHAKRKVTELLKIGKNIDTSLSNKVNIVIDKIGKVKFPPLPKDSAFDHFLSNNKNQAITICKSIYSDSVLSLNSNIPFSSSPGKLYSFFVTFNYLSQNPKQFLMGAGAGNFSSKFTFRALALNNNGTWPKKLIHFHESFKENHLKIWMYYQLQPPKEHSVLNSPNSCLNQLLGEYGLIGLMLFLIFYVWYFLKNYRKLSYGKYLLPMCLAFLLTDYWFENFSILVFFELFMFIDLKNNHIEQQA